MIGSLTLLDISINLSLIIGRTAAGCASDGMYRCDVMSSLSAKVVKVPLANGNSGRPVGWKQRIGNSDKEKKLRYICMYYTYSSV